MVKRQRAESQAGTRKSPRVAAAAGGAAAPAASGAAAADNSRKKKDKLPKDEPTKANPKKAEPIKTETTEADSTKAEPTEAKYTKGEPTKAKSTKAEPAKKTKSTKETESTKNAKSAKAESTKETPTTVDDDTAPQDLYAVLGVDRDASHEEIRKAYRRMALQLHPDKNPGDETAKGRFQTLQRVFAVLGDEEKRKIYDETGCTDDEDGFGGSGNVADLHKYFRTVFTKITVEDIVAFEKQYRGSPQEAKELKDLYKRFKGRMNMVLECQICTRPEIDSHRFMDILNAAIESGELEATRAYKRWAAEVSKKPAPADPLGVSNDSTENNQQLTALIRGKKKAGETGFFDSLADKLAAKYGGSDEVMRGGKRGGKSGAGKSGGGKRGGKSGGKRGGKGKAGEDEEGGEGDEGRVQVVSRRGWKEPTEEEFQAARARALKEP